MTLLLHMRQMLAGGTPFSEENSRRGTSPFAGSPSGTRRMTNRQSPYDRRRHSTSINRPSPYDRRRNSTSRPKPKPQPTFAAAARHMTASAAMSSALVRISSTIGFASGASTRKLQVIPAETRSSEEVESRSPEMSPRGKSSNATSCASPLSAKGWALIKNVTGDQQVDVGPTRRIDLLDRVM